MVDIPGADVINSIPRPNFQFTLLNATVRSQEVLGEKQSTSSDSSILATDLLTVEYDESTTVLQNDTDDIVDYANSVGSEWSSSETTEFNVLNQTYQNDSAVCQTGQSNADTAVQTAQTQSSQDGTNLSNLVSLSSTLITIGQYVAGLIGQSY